MLFCHVSYKYKTMYILKAVQNTRHYTNIQNVKKKSSSLTLSNNCIQHLCCTDTNNKASIRKDKEKQRKNDEKSL